MLVQTRAAVEDAFNVVQKLIVNCGPSDIIIHCSTQQKVYIRLPCLLCSWSADLELSQRYIIVH